MRVSDDASAGLPLIQVQEDPLELRRQLGPGAIRHAQTLYHSSGRRSGIYGLFLNKPLTCHYPGHHRDVAVTRGRHLVRVSAISSRRSSGAGHYLFASRGQAAAVQHGATALPRTVASKHYHQRMIQLRQRPPSLAEYAQRAPGLGSRMSGGHGLGLGASWLGSGHAAAKRAVWKWRSHGGEEGRDRRQEQGPLQEAA
jgi:hypothetical protein